MGQEGAQLPYLRHPLVWLREGGGGRRLLVVVHPKHLSVEAKNRSAPFFVCFLRLFTLAQCFMFQPGKANSAVVSLV
jgi:hypothetical protein